MVLSIDSRFGRGRLPFIYPPVIPDDVSLLPTGHLKQNMLSPKCKNND
jgi:hypothetical protein